MEFDKKCDYSTAYGYKCCAAYGQGSGPVVLDDVYCAGTETEVLECSFGAGIDTHNCQHSEDVGIFCPPRKIL